MITSTLIFLLGLTAIFIIFIGIGIFWAIKSGQFEDMEGPAQRILMDEDDPMLPSNQLNPDDAKSKSKLQ